MHTICQDVSAVSRTLRIPRADLAGARNGHGEIVLYLVHQGVLVDQLTLPVHSFGIDLPFDQIAVRDYGEHFGLSRTLAAAGIAEPLRRDQVAGTPIVLMSLASCLVERLPVVSSAVLVAA